MFEANVFQSRRQKLLDRLADNSLTVLFSGVAPHKSRDAAYHFHINRNFYYLTGLDREQMALILTKKDGQTTSTLLIEVVDPTVEKWTGKRMRAAVATERSGINTVQDIADLHNVIGRLLLDSEYDTLHLDIEQSNWAQLETAAHRFAHEVQTRYPGVRIQNVYKDICRLRRVKDEHEVKAIRQAIQATKDGIEAMMTNARPNINEYELEAHFDYALRSQGISEHAFPSIIAGGERATVLHYEENDQPIANGQLVLCDLGAAYAHYSADITRTFPVSGHFTNRQKEIYEIVLLAMDETMAAIKPGLTCAQLNDVTKATLARELKRIGLIENDEQVSQYYYHGVSHPLGLDTHDVGARDWPIEIGAVLTIEPGLYIAEEGIGIRIEDDVLVTADGYENLSKDIIKRVQDIESFMSAL